MISDIQYILAPFPTDQIKKVLDASSPICDPYTYIPEINKELDSCPDCLIRRCMDRSKPFNHFSIANVDLEDELTRRHSIVVKEDIR
jgi:hypothetical protein